MSVLGWGKVQPCGFLTEKLLPKLSSWNSTICFKFGRQSTDIVCAYHAVARSCYGQHKRRALYHSSVVRLAGVDFNRKHNRVRRDVDALTDFTANSVLAGTSSVLKLDVASKASHGTFAVFVAAGSITVFRQRFCDNKLTKRCVIKRYTTYPKVLSHVRRFRPSSTAPA